MKWRSVVLDERHRADPRSPPPRSFGIRNDEWARTKKRMHSAKSGCASPQMRPYNEIERGLELGLHAGCDARGLESGNRVNGLRRPAYRRAAGASHRHRNPRSCRECDAPSGARDQPSQASTPRLGRLLRKWPRARRNSAPRVLRASGPRRERSTSPAPSADSSSTVCWLTAEGLAPRRKGARQRSNALRRPARKNSMPQMRGPYQACSTNDFCPTGRDARPIAAATANGGHSAHMAE